MDNKIERLELKNFTVFTDLELKFSPRINVIIGENGAGKTHLLKAAYGLCATASLFKTEVSIRKGPLEAALTEKLLRLFMPMENKLGKLHRQGAEERGQLTAHFVGGPKIAANFFNNSQSVAIDDRTDYEQYQAESVLIPSKEVLSLVKGMTDENHDQDTVELIFDDSYIDLAKSLMKSPDKDLESRINQDPRLNVLIPQLVNLVGGRYQWGNGGFCFQAGKYVERESPSRTQAKAAQVYQDSTVTEFVAKSGHVYSSGMTAEGFRKIGILHRLLSNGTISPGSSGPFFWDEPESNMNPKLMRMLVQLLLELSRNGQQIILATHDYVLLKWFDLLFDKGKDDHVRFHVLKLNDGVLGVESADSYQTLPEHSIARTFSDLYDAEIQRSLGGTQ